MVPITYVMTPDERSAFAALGCLEAIRSGTTTIVDPLRHVASYAPAMVNSGLRLFLSESAADALTLEVRRGVYEYSRAWGETFLDRTQALIEAHHMTHQGRVQCQIAAHATDNCSPWMLEQLLQLAERYQLRRTIHLAQGQGEVDQIRAAHQLTPAAYLDQNDWLGPDLVAAHWSFCTDQDIERLADTGTHMAHCPANSSRRGSHWGVKMPQIFDAGVNVALGTDNMTEDMFQAMRIGIIINRGKRGGGEFPMPQTLVQCATRNGALALNRSHDLGAIEPGKKADLTLLNLQRAHLSPLINLYSNLVHYGHPSDVESVLVDGEFIMQDGRVLTMNEADVIRHSQEAAVSAWRRFQETYPDIALPPGLIFQ